MFPLTRVYKGYEFSMIYLNIVLKYSPTLQRSRFKKQCKYVINAYLAICKPSSWSYNSLLKWWRHLTMLWYRHKVVPNKLTRANRTIMLIFCMCFTNGKDIVQSQIWSTFVAELWLRKTKIQDRVWILVLVRVLWVRISRIWHSFFNFTFKSSSIFYPIGITWRKWRRSVCLKPVSRKLWHLHALWRFTSPANYDQNF